jgi:hypothetical protein
MHERAGAADAMNDPLHPRGALARPPRPFGAPDALRITAGTLDEVAFLGEALAAIRAPVATAPTR